MAVSFPESLSPHSPINESTIKALSKFSKDPKTIKAFAKYLFGKPNTSKLLDDFILTVEKSPLPIEEWVLGLHKIYDWQAQNKKQVSFKNSISYLSCCGEGCNWSPTQFQETISTYLAKYGIEAST